MCLTAFLLVVELFGVELVIADNAPVIAGAIHRETWRQGANHADDHGVLAPAAVPGEVPALHEIDHLPEPRVRIHHFVTGVLLPSQPSYGLFHSRPVVLGYVRNVIGGVVEVLVLFDRRRFVDMVVGGNAAAVCDFR